MAQLHATRLQRLNAQGQAEWHAISTALRDPVAEDKDVLLAVQEGSCDETPFGGIFRFSILYWHFATEIAHKPSV
jgi:hypothetical protein